MPRAGEFEAIERIRLLLSGSFLAPAGDVWIGDDAAVLKVKDGFVLLCTDLTVAGVHADLDVVGLEDFGWRALVSSLSDVAAMGGEAPRAVLAVAGPPDTDLELLYRGIEDASRAHGCPVVGGDLSNSGQLTVAASVVGLVDRGPPPVLRSGARPGDTLFVTGELGGACAGLRELLGRRGEADPDLVAAHLRPRAQLEAGRTARRAGASAMIDVSDGLLADVVHMALASGVGIALSEVPVAPGASLEDALNGGEDYQLVVATPDPERLTEMFEASSPSALYEIGKCTSDPSQRTLRGERFVAAGYEHNWRIGGTAGGSGASSQI
jgi:thiamine-monophosphate kinase